MYLGVMNLFGLIQKTWNFIESSYSSGNYILEDQSFLVRLWLTATKTNLDIENLIYELPHELRKDLRL